MIESMTGYGGSSQLLNGFTIEAEIKSINSRFLDISLRLPRSLNDKEIEIRNIIKQNINRGKITLNIYLKKDGVENGIPSYDEKTLKGIANLLRKIKSDSELKEEIQLSDILSVNSLDMLNAIAENNFRRDRDIPGDLSLEEAGYWFKDDQFRLNDNFAVGKSGLIFHFDQYEIAPYSFGPIEITIGYDQIDFLTNLR